MLLKHLPKKKILLFAGDIFAVASSCFLAIAICREFSASEHLVVIFLVVSVYPFTFYVVDLYDVSTKFTNPKYLYRFMVSMVISTTLAATAFFFLLDIGSVRRIFMITSLLIPLLTFVWRLIFERSLSSLLRVRKNLLIVGAGKSGKMLYSAIKNDLRYHVVGFVDDDPGKRGVVNSPAVIGDSSELDSLVAGNKVDSVIIAITCLKGPELLRSTLKCKMKGVHVHDMRSFYEEVAGKVPVQHVDDFWLVSSPLLGVRKKLYNLRLKRLLDLAFSFTGIILTIPVTVLTVITIKLDSKGPVFYKQKRVGLNNRHFEVIKFRSMTVEAEKNGAVWAMAEDPRVTRVGRIIRKLRIDEIPQMWNVVKGEMSFIGPRPERPEFVRLLEEHIPYYSLRHSVKPGITGWAQVNYPYGASEEDALEKLQYDLFYIKNLVPSLDFHILLKTVKVVLFGKGAR